MTPKKTPKHNIAESSDKPTVDKHTHPKHKADQMIQKAATLPALELTSKQKRIKEAMKKEMDDVYAKATDLLVGGKYFDAIELFDTIISNKALIEKHQLTIDQRVIQGAIICATSIRDGFLKGAVKMLNSGDDSMIFPPVKKPDSLKMRSDQTTILTHTSKKPSSPQIKLSPKNGLNLEDTYDIYDPKYIEGLKIREKSSQDRIKKALPYFTRAMEYCSHALKYKDLLTSLSKKMSSSLKVALQLNMGIKNLLEKSGIKDHVRKIESSEDGGKALSDFYREQGKLLGMSTPKRKAHIWTFRKVARNPKLSPTLEHKGVKPIRVHKEERALLGITKHDPILLLNIITDYITKDWEKTKNPEEREFGDLTLKLANALQFFKDNPQHLRESGVGPFNLSEQFNKDKTPDQRKKEAKEIFKKIKQLAVNLSASKERINDTKFQILIKNLRSIPNWQALVKFVLQSKENEEWPKSKEDEQSADPRVELYVNLSALNLLKKAIQLNPKQQENYEAMLNLLEKIGFDDKITKKLKEDITGVSKIKDEKGREMAFSKLHKPLVDQIDMTIGSRSPSIPYTKYPWLSKLTGDTPTKLGSTGNDSFGAR